MNLVPSIFIEQKQERGKFAFLDGIRGFAVLTVVFSHSNNQGQYYSSKLRLIAESGVWAFFVLSAFLLTLNLLNRMEKYSLRLVMTDYAMKRFLRIYPMYLAAVVYFNGWAGLTYERFFLVRCTPSFLWTIPVEMQSYAILPFIAIIATYAGKHAYGFGLLSVIGLFCYNVLTVPRVGNESANIDLAMSLPVFLMGSLLALIYRKVKDVKILPTVSVLLDAICWVFFAVFIYNCQENPIWFNKPTIGNNLMVQSPILTVILLLALMTTTNGSFVGFFEWNFLRFCGKISYSMYLTHVIAIDHRAYFLPLLSGDIGILGVFLLAIGLATIGYHLVEVPIANTMVHLSNALKKYYLKDKKPYLPVNSEENRN